MFYFTLVLVPSDTQDVMAEVERLLEPFGQTLEQVPCDCQTGNRPGPCEWCGEAGELIVDTNKDTKWDWWIPGGRYDGRVRNEPPERMKRFGHHFYFACGLELAFGSSMVQPPQSGEETESSDRAFDEFLAANTVPVRDLPADLTCAAVVTPDGAWHGKDCPLAPLDSVADEQWLSALQALLAAHQDCLAVGCELQHRGFMPQPPPSEERMRRLEEQLKRLGLSTDGD